MKILTKKSYCSFIFILYDSVGKKVIIFVFQKQKETFQQDEIPITLSSSNVTTKPSELSSTPANASNKVLTTPLEAGTQNKTQLV